MDSVSIVAPAKRRPANPFKPGFDPRRNLKGSGRPKSWRCVADQLRKIAAETDPETGQQRIETLCRHVWKQAMAGRTWALNFIASRTDGNAVERTLEATQPQRGES